MLLALPVCNSPIAWNTCVGGFNVLHLSVRYMNIGCLNILKIYILTSYEIV